MKRPWLRVLIASILSFILFAVLGCAGALWYIQDPVRLRPLLGKILDKFATEYGVQITFSEARFNLLSGLHLRGLQAHFAANGTRIDAQIESLDLDYAFHVFTFDPAARKITISRFRVLRPRIAIEQTPEPEARSQSNSTQTLDALAAKFSGWLDSPWATLAIADFSVDGLDLALKVGANRELRISSVTLAADAKIERGRAQLNLRSQNYGGGQLRFGARKSAGETLADLKSWKTKWEFLIEKTDSILKFKIARGELALKLQRLRTTKYSAKKIAILAKLALAPDHDFSVYGRKEEVGHVEFSVALDAQLAGAHAKLQARGGATASAARQNVRATTELDVKNQTWGHWLAISKINVERENQRLAGQIDLDLPSVPLKMAWLRDAVIRASGEIRDQKKWTIQNFAMALGGKNIQLSGAAAGTLPSKDFRANAELQVSIPGEITVLDKTTYIGGRLAVPVQIAFARGRDIDIDGSMKFVDFR